MSAGEFAIVLFRHENENVAGEFFGIPISLISKDSDNGHFNDAMKSWVDDNKSWIVNWRPDITIDECRGKVILISRFSGSWEYGCFTGWNHDEGGAIATIKNHLDISATFHTVEALKK